MAETDHLKMDANEDPVATVMQASYDVYDARAALEAEGHNYYSTLRASDEGRRLADSVEAFIESDSSGSKTLLDNLPAEIVSRGEEYTRAVIASLARGAIHNKASDSVEEDISEALSGKHLTIIGLNDGIRVLSPDGAQSFVQQIGEVHGTFLEYDVDSGQLIIEDDEGREFPLYLWVQKYNESDQVVPLDMANLIQQVDIYIDGYLE